MTDSLNKYLWAIGLMSGTSADGIDTALIQTDGVTIKAFGPTHFVSYPETFKRDILKAYGTPPPLGTHPLEQSLTEHHAEAVNALLQKAKMKPQEVDLIGFHGQTLFHNPPSVTGEKGETYAIGDGSLLATLTGISVVDQFRLNDIAHGGQGAPFVPLFHQALAKNLPKPLAIINIGGVANITWIGRQEDALLAFDTGPGNGLIDDWVRFHRNIPCDEGGKIAATGRVHHDLLVRWLFHPYFSKKPPKSLDRLTFKFVSADLRFLSVEDGTATLTAFTAACIQKAREYLPQPPVLWLVTGGGAHNPVLLHMINSQLITQVQKVSQLGWDGDALEAQAFGFLAVRALKNLPLSLPGTTGVPYPLSGGRVCKYS